MEEERDILAFTERLKDRFGKIPQEGKELIRIPAFAFLYLLGNAERYGYRGRD